MNLKTGEEKKKNLKLGMFLAEGEDYTVSYDKNRSKGTATILFTGINGYTGASSAAPV